MLSDESPSTRETQRADREREERQGASEAPGPCKAILYYTILYYTILYHTILYDTILYYTILYYTILYYTILYYTILYYTILYYTILQPSGINKSDSTLVFEYYTYE